MKKLLIILMSISMAFTMQAQMIINSSGKPGKASYRNNSDVVGFSNNKIFVGSNLDMGLMYDFFMIGLTPHAGYRFNQYFSAGVSGRFMYLSLRDHYQLPDGAGGYTYKPLRQKIYGPGVFGRLHFLETYFLQVEYEYNIVNTIGYAANSSYTGFNKIKDSYGVSSLLVGGGYFMDVSERSSIYATLMYDALQNSTLSTAIDPVSMKRSSISPYAGQLIYRVGIAIRL